MSIDELRAQLQSLNKLPPIPALEILTRVDISEAGRVSADTKDRFAKAIADCEARLNSIRNLTRRLLMCALTDEKCGHKHTWVIAPRLIRPTADSRYTQIVNTTHQYLTGTAVQNPHPACHIVRGNLRLCEKTFRDWWDTPGFIEEWHGKTGRGTAGDIQKHYPEIVWDEKTFSATVSVMDIAGEMHSIVQAFNPARIEHWLDQLWLLNGEIDMDVAPWHLKFNTPVSFAPPPGGSRTIPPQCERVFDYGKPSFDIWLPSAAIITTHLIVGTIRRMRA